MPSPFHQDVMLDNLMKGDMTLLFRTPKHDHEAFSDWWSMSILAFLSQLITRMVAERMFKIIKTHTYDEKMRLAYKRFIT